MLVLIKQDDFIREVAPNSRFDIDGNTVMPAIAGWSKDDYSLHEIQPAAPIPEGKVATGTSVDLVGSEWTYVHTLEDEPVITPEELRAQMPDKTPREFRDALVDMGIDPKSVTIKIEEIPFDIERQKALNAWEVPTMISRVDPYVDMIGAMFDISPEDIDEAW